MGFWEKYKEICDEIERNPQYVIIPLIGCVMLFFAVMLIQLMLM